MSTRDKVIKQTTSTSLNSIKWAVILIIALNMEVLAAVIINARTLRIRLDLHMNVRNLQRVEGFEPQENQTRTQIRFSTTMPTKKSRISHNITSCPDRIEATRVWSIL